MKGTPTAERVEATFFSGRRGRIFGVLHLPPQSEATDTKRLESEAHHYSSVVFCHGFTGEHVGPNRLGVEFARAAAAAGIAVFRFDCVGSGNSDGVFETDTHITGWVEDLTDAVKFVRRHPEIDATRIGTLGLSMGGAVALLVGKLDGLVAAVGCWSPVVHPVENFRERVLGRAMWSRLERGETARNFYNKGFAIGPHFIDDLARHDVEQAAADIAPVPLWVAHGELDRVIPVAQVRALKERIGDAMTLRVVEGADHVFSEHRREVVAATVAWFEAHL